jgi:hypothetical protein
MKRFKKLPKAIIHSVMFTLVCVSHTVYGAYNFVETALSLSKHAVKYTWRKVF